jgi:enoyl-CoA hydratase/carnithine racemase
MSGRFGERGGRVEGRLATLQLLEGTCGVLYRSMGLLQSLPKAQATHQLHDLALTLAALDRLLTSYVHQVLHTLPHAPQPPLALMQLVCVYVGCGCAVGA